MQYHRIGPAGLFCQEDDFADPWEAHDTVLLQHGFARNGNMFYGWVPHLCRDFGVLRPDLRGMGRSADPGAGYQFTLDDLLGDFLTLLDALEIESVHYVGESLGGILGIALAAKHPDRVRSLTLVSTIVQVRQESTVTLSSLGYPTWADALQALGMRQWWLAFRARTGELTGNTAKDTWFADECARTPVHVAQALSRFAPGVSVQTLLPQVKAPTLVLSPGRSLHTAEGEQDLILRSIPGAQRIAYEDGKHIDCFLRPDRMAADTLAFLQSLRQRNLPSPPKKPTRRAE